ncbi:hypothetical protein ACUXV3_12275 [Roseobacteraceae bacterium NS-SX3]
MSKNGNTETTKQAIASQEGGVVAKLQKHKAAHSGTDSTLLPETGITVTWPSFRAHATWMKAQKLARKNPLSVTDVYLALVCKFDGERLTLEQFSELLPTNDVLVLTGKVLGDEDEGGETGGNALH